MRTAALILALAFTFSGCGRLLHKPEPKRFGTVRIATPPASITANPAIQPFINQILAANSPSALYASGPFTGSTTVSASVPVVRVGVSIVPAGPPPRPAFQPFLQAGPTAQQEIVKLLTERAKTNPESALDLLHDFVRGSRADAAEDPAQIRVEATFSQALALPGSWERAESIATYLILHDENLRFTDTNQSESVLRDIEFGTLTQSNEISASASVDITRAAEDAVTGGGITSKDSGSNVGKTGLTAKAVDTLVRRISAQFAARATGIECDGRVFRLTQRTSLETALPGMVRQILTLRFKDAKAEPHLEVRYAEDGSVRSLARADVPKPELPEGAIQKGGTWAFDATPLMVAWVRRVGSVRTASTVLEDDDQAELHPEFAVLNPVTVARIDNRSYGLKVDGRDLYVQNFQIDRPTLVLFRAAADAARFAEAITLRLGAGNAPEDGVLFSAAKGWRFALPNARQLLQLPAAAFDWRAVPALPVIETRRF